MIEEKIEIDPHIWHIQDNWISKYANDLLPSMPEDKAFPKRTIEYIYMFFLEEAQKVVDAMHQRGEAIPPFVMMGVYYIYNRKRVIIQLPYFVKNNQVVEEPQFIESRRKTLRGQLGAIFN